MIPCIQNKAVRWRLWQESVNVDRPRQMTKWLTFFQWVLKLQFFLFCSFRSSKQWVNNCSCSLDSIAVLGFQDFYICLIHRVQTKKHFILSSVLVIQQCFLAPCAGSWGSDTLKLFQMFQSSWCCSCDVHLGFFLKCADTGLLFLCFLGG